MRTVRWEKKNTLFCGILRAVSTAFSITCMFAQLNFVNESAHAQTFTVLYSFQGGSDGSFPVAGLLRDSNGNLFSTTDYGGDFGYGTVFELDASGTETVLYSFTGGRDGGYPLAGLVQDAAGNLYGTTSGGGKGGNGTVFKLNEADKETVLYKFNGADGAGPCDALGMDANGILYGTTLAGGTHGVGVAFELNTKDKETVLHNLAGPPDGALPYAGLIQDPEGNRYGTTLEGGKYGSGTIFKVDKTGREKVLYTFTGGTDGAFPWGTLVRDRAGNLYGTANLGGDFACDPYGCGVVFKLDTSGKETVLYSFKDRDDGGFPYTGLAMDASGNLYGVTQGGGASGVGVVFEVDTNRKETPLYSFTGGNDGAFPFGGLVLDSAGNIYGTAEYGGTTFNGTVFKIMP